MNNDLLILMKIRYSNCESKHLVLRLANSVTYCALIELAEMVVIFSLEEIELK